MSKIKRTTLTVLLALCLPIVGTAGRAEGQANAVDNRAFPNLTQIYVTSGVRDNGAGTNAGVATTVHCTNWTAATQQIRFLVRNAVGALAANVTSQTPSLWTRTASTHLTAAFGEELVLATGPVGQGSLRIFATAPQITCTAVVIDASTLEPVGTNLHLVRHNPWPNAQE